MLPLFLLRYTSAIVMLRTFLFCAFVICLFYAHAQETAPPASVAHAQQLMDEGKLQQALDELNGLTPPRVEPAGAARLRGFIYYQQGKMVEAESAFATAMQQDPKDTEAMQMRGVALFRMGRPADAIPFLEKAHTLVESANIDPNYVLGVCYMDTHRYDDARHAFAMQYKFSPDSAQAYLLAARMFFHRELILVAEESAHKAVQLNPALPLAHQLLGEIALAKADAPGAIGELEKEREINPLNSEVYDRLGDAYIRNGQYIEAQLALDRAILLSPNMTGPYILLGKALLMQQNPVMAAMYLERALHLDPNNYIAHALLGQAYRSLGRRDDAARELQTAEKLQAVNPPQANNAKQ